MKACQMGKIESKSKLNGGKMITGNEVQTAAKDGGHMTGGERSD